MTLKSRAALISQANAMLPDNDTQQISPADVRNMFKDDFDSSVSKSGDTGILGTLQYVNLLTITDGKQLVYADWVSNKIASFLSANIVDFGAKGDGVSDDTAAIQAAIDTGLAVFFPSTVLISGSKTIANYLISENLILNDNQKIYGHNSKVSSVTIGDSSSLSSAFNFFVCGTGTIIEGLNLAGSGKGTYVFPWTSQNGIWHQSGNNQVINCSFKDLAGSAILGVNGSLSIFNFNKIVNVTINSCTVGVFNYVGSEYQNIIGGSIVACNVGILELGANNSVVGCNVDYNDTGISIGNNGANSDHGDFIGGTLNHNSIPISCNGLAVGYIFSGVNIFDGIVNISQADKLIFSACAFENIDFEISATTTVKTVQFIGGYQIGTTSYTVTGTANIMKAGVIGDNESNYKISTDIEIVDVTKGLIMTDTNGSSQKYRIIITDAAFVFNPI